MSPETNTAQTSAVPVASKPGPSSPLPISTSISSSPGSASPPVSSSPPVAGAGSPPDLRRLTSSGSLASPPLPLPQKQNSLSPRNSIHAGRAGLSPSASIPSSPTSVHSSSSAIFERDVEPLSVPSLTPSTAPTVAHKESAHHLNPHLIPRGRGTEQLEQSVPSVLDEAVTVLASGADAEDHVAVVAPVSTSVASSMFGSPNDYGSIGNASPLQSRSRSRSPSPMGLRVGQRQSLLLNLPASPASPGSPVHPSSPGTAVPRPAMRQQQTITPANISRTTSAQSAHSAYYSVASDEEDPAGSSLSNTEPPSMPSTIGRSSRRSSALLSAMPPSPGGAGGTISKRLSFISYADLLQSTPASTQSLAALTQNATSEAPPPHIPSVASAISAPAGSEYDGGSTASSVHRLSGVPHGFLGTGHGHGFTHASAGHGAMAKRESAVLDDVGGEWEREGMGMGLEERLEAVINTGGSPAVNARA